MDAPPIQAIRGSRDVLHPRRAAERALESRLQEAFALYGYELIDTPIVEPAELFLRKHGETIAARMYAFTYWNRQLCLRPEFTASVIRAYVNHLQDRSLPLRLQYAGPSFRYEKPQQGRHRQFTEVGAECIGAAGPAADGEVLAVARHGLEAVGVQGAHFVVGHLGAVLGLLAQLGMDGRAQSLVLAEMERFAPVAVDTAPLVERMAALLVGDSNARELDKGGVSELLQSLGEEAAAQLTADLLERANLSLDGGTRRPEEIVERLLRKSRRPDPTPALQRAVEFVRELRGLVGPPEEALPALRALLSRYGLDPEPVGEVERALDCFNAYFDAPARVQVDLSLARGLRYYTGLLFEVYDSEESQLAGGGRYDDLVRSLGGRQPVPACGFSLGLERVAVAIERKADTDQPDSVPRKVLVVPLAAEDYGEAARLATWLRRAGTVVELDLKFRGPRTNLRHADRARIPLVIIVGERERANGIVTLHDVRRFEEVQVASAEAPAAVQSRLEGLV